MPRSFAIFCCLLGPWFLTACKTPERDASVQAAGDQVTVGDAWGQDVKAQVGALKGKRQEVTDAAETLAFAANSPDESASLADLLKKVQDVLTALGALIDDFELSLAAGKTAGDPAAAHNIAVSRLVPLTVQAWSPTGEVAQVVTVDVGFQGVLTQLRAAKQQARNDLLLKAGKLMQASPTERKLALGAMRRGMGELGAKLAVIQASIGTWFGEGGDAADVAPPPGAFTDPDAKFVWKHAGLAKPKRAGAARFAALGAGAVTGDAVGFADGTKRRGNAEWNDVNAIAQVLCNK